MSEHPATGSKEWLRCQIAEFDRLAPQLRSFAESLERVLESAAGERAPQAIVQTRVKAPASFAQKALKKQSKYDCPVHQFTDLCGGRVVARTRNEVDAMARFIEGFFEIDSVNSVDASRRLHLTEFGYRSIHYIVSFGGQHRGDVPDDVFGFACDVCGEHYPLKAEIQVRTLAEHAWSDFAHDLSYKGAFELPARFTRELSGIAAELEDVDRAFARIEDELRVYAAEYGTFLTVEERVARIAQLEMVLEIDPYNARLGWEIGKLAIVGGDWDKARDVFERFVDVADPAASFQPVLRDLGRILSRGRVEGFTPDDTERGRRLLEMAVESDPSDPHALSALADTWRGIDDDEARGLYLRAFRLDPSVAYPLVRYLEYQVAQEGNAGMLEVIGPLADRAVARCAAHAAVGVNLPWAFFERGELQLLMGQPFEALDSYARAVVKATTGVQISDALDGVERLAQVSDRIPGVEWVRDLLLAAMVGRYPSEQTAAAIADRATGTKLHGPVLMVAGTTEAGSEAETGRNRARLADVLRDFEGTVISGGTRDGIAGLVGEFGIASPGRVSTVRYLPVASAMVGADDRYTTLCRIGDGFSPGQALASWIDVIASGIDPAEVKVLGIGGGDIAAAEYRIALALGATVGVIAGSGRSADDIVTDPEWTKATNLQALPDDPWTLRAFIGIPAMPWTDEVRDRLAEEIHRRYRDDQMKKQAKDKPNQAPRESLLVMYQESNRLQALHIGAKLAEIGCQVVPAADADEDFHLCPDEIELLAEMEHGRWNAERLADGWTWGEEKSDEHRISPYLVAWRDLPDDIRDYDRAAVKQIRDLLADQDLGVRRLGPDPGCGDTAGE